MSRFFKRQADSSDSESSSSEEEELLSDDSGDEPKAKPTTSAKPMSRFLKKTGGDDSDSSSSSGSESDDDHDNDGDGTRQPKKASKFLVKGDASSSGSESDDDVKVVVKSARDKRLEELDALGRTIENAVRINDWVAINNGILSFHSLYLT